jgi:hypothetical protein
MPDHDKRLFTARHGEVQKIVHLIKKARANGGRPGPVADCFSQENIVSELIATLETL